jgi:hypothetical protein
MTYRIDSKSKRYLPTKLAAGIAISALLVLGTFVASASADEHHQGARGHGNRHVADYRGGRGYDGGGWGGGYYNSPPVVYGSPYYYPPPVVYGPGIGISLPGVGIGIY